MLGNKNSTAAVKCLQPGILSKILLQSKSCGSEDFHQLQFFKACHGLQSQLLEIAFNKKLKLTRDDLFQVQDFSFIIKQITEFK